MKVVAIILAGGKGTRLSKDIPKQFIEINNKIILQYSIEKFQNNENIDEIYISALDGFDNIFNELKLKFNKIVKIVKGGSERQHSVFNALNEFKSDIVIIHDGARPFVTDEEINQTIFVAKEKGACTTALPVKDTIKICENEKVKTTLDRNVLYSIKTPQAFDYKSIFEAHLSANEDNFIGTDDCSLIERMGKDVHIVIADDNNIKITSNIDLVVAKSIINDFV